MVVVLAVVFAWNHGLRTAYEKERIKRTLTSQIKDLEAPLERMGFSLSNIKAACERGEGSDLYCNARVNSFVVIRSTPEELNQQAAQLSDLLNQHGWHQRPDYPTKDWFNKISQQVDYQPDQLNTKTVDGMDCTVDFFTAFSKPKPAAVTLSADCSKGTPAAIPID